MVWLVNGLHNNLKLISFQYLELSRASMLLLCFYEQASNEPCSDFRVSVTSKKWNRLFLFCFHPLPSCLSVTLRVAQFRAENLFSLYRHGCFLEYIELTFLVPESNQLETKGYVQLLLSLFFDPHCISSNENPIFCWHWPAFSFLSSFVLCEEERIRVKIPGWWIPGRAQNKRR